MISLAKDPVELVALGAPHVITSEQMLEQYTAKLFELTSIDEPSQEEIETIDLISLLIESYEREHYSIPAATSGMVLEFLMDQHNLQPKDLAAELGSELDVSRVISGEVLIEPHEAVALSQRFNVLPSIFVRRA